MKSLATLGFGPHTYLIEDEDLPFDETPVSKTTMIQGDLFSEEALTPEERERTETEQQLQQLIQALKCKKIHLLRWDDESTQTTYLKMDWGVLSTIRISSDMESGTYRYKYNLILGAKKGAVQKEAGVVREYYTLNELDALISSIEIEREEKIYQYGLDHYQKYIRENQQKAKNQKGFFEKAKQV